MFSGFCCVFLFGRLNVISTTLRCAPVSSGILEEKRKPAFTEKKLTKQKTVSKIELHSYQWFMGPGNDRSENFEQSCSVTQPNVHLFGPKMHTLYNHFALVT